MIRPAMPADAAAITDIWNAVIRDTTITFNPTEMTEGEVSALIAKDTLVLEEDGQTLGFVRFFPFRAGEGYKYTVEHTIMLHPDARGRGAGRALLTALSEMAKAQGTRTMIAGCSGESPAAIRFHTACGFQTVATLPEVGFKFGRWIDLVLMQKRL
ncbi:N-acetyltransferase family protein [Cognatiyoonia sp. IB215182]|uniref:GNAT family N-acetyltransferase n=1 Tax=Cognatiyoonia sp. IB215182 TaxID=3097353 RepID=UPI002A176B88|nr:N-acetyltransferase family protein [Cognatiyoonia sp. IB215182]MDX8353722.1 GNAT family N-acetyltransferase [Cognatiyoonia sp. IB215182]